MADYRLALMTGIDIPMPEFTLIMHQPTIKEISFMGESRFFTAVQLLTIDEAFLSNIMKNSEVQIQPQDLFKLFLQIMQDDKEKQKILKDLLTLCFQKQKIIFTPRALNFLSENNEIISTLNEDNFSIFQTYFQTVFCLSNRQDVTYNPANAKAKEIANKLYRARQRVAAQQTEKDKKSLDTYISSMVIAIPSMSLNDVVNLTLYQLYDLLERYGLYVNWDLDIKCRLAGGGSEKEQESWMKNIH